MRLGILGGTFDPVHYGHLVIAEECRVRLGLEEVLFIPAGEPPHKRRNTITPAEHRLAMVKLAVASNPGFRVSRLEIDRSGPSYSVDTVESLRAELGPGAELHFIVGVDALADIITWRDPARLVCLCRIVAIRRPGFHDLDLKFLDSAIPGAAQRITMLSAPELNISATNLRQRVAAGLPIKYQVPEQVEEYIHRTELYGRVGVADGT